MKKNSIFKVFAVIIASVVISAVMSGKPQMVSAANGPAEGDDSYAYIQIGAEVIGQTEWGSDRYCNHYVYMSDNMKQNYELNEYETYELIKDSAVKYDKKTNTLTLNDYSGEEIDVNMMGDDFKIELAGVSTIEKLYLYTDYYGCNLTITGKGTLNIRGGSFFDEEELYGKSGLRIECESQTAKTKLTVEKGATLHVEGNGSYTYPLIGVYGTNEEKNGIVLNGVKLAGSYISQSVVDFEKYVDFEDEDSFQRYFLVSKGGKTYYSQEDHMYDLSADITVSSYVVYDENLDYVKTFSSLEEMEAAGYKGDNRQAYTYVVCGKECTISADADEKAVKGYVFANDNYSYAVLTEGKKGKAGTVTATGLVSWSTSVDSIVIPKTVKYNGITYKVTAINESAFSVQGGIKKITIGANVKSIGTSAFAYMEDLEEIVINSKKLKSSTVKKNAFENIPETVTVKVPKGKASSYKKLLQSKGLSKKAVVK